MQSDIMIEFDADIKKYLKKIRSMKLANKIIKKDVANIRVGADSKNYHDKMKQVNNVNKKIKKDVGKIKVDADIKPYVKKVDKVDKANKKAKKSVKKTGGEWKSQVPMISGITEMISSPMMGAVVGVSLAVGTIVKAWADVDRRAKETMNTMKPFYDKARDLSSVADDTHSVSQLENIAKNIARKSGATGNEAIDLVFNAKSQGLLTPEYQKRIVEIIKRNTTENANFLLTGGSVLKDVFGSDVLQSQNKLQYASSKSKFQVKGISSAISDTAAIFQSMGGKEEELLSMISGSGSAKTAEMVGTQFKQLFSQFAKGEPIQKLGLKGDFMSRFSQFMKYVKDKNLSEDAVTGMLGDVNAKQAYISLSKQIKTGAFAKRKSGILGSKQIEDYDISDNQRLFTASRIAERKKEYAGEGEGRKELGVEMVKNLTEAFVKEARVKDIGAYTNTVVAGVLDKFGFEVFSKAQEAMSGGAVKSMERITEKSALRFSDAVNRKIDGERLLQKKSVQEKLLKGFSFNFGGMTDSIITEKTTSNENNELTNTTKELLNETKRQNNNYTANRGNKE